MFGVRIKKIWNISVFQLHFEVDFLEIWSVWLYLFLSTFIANALYASFIYLQNLQWYSTKMDCSRKMPENIWFLAESIWNRSSRFFSHGRTRKRISATRILHHAQFEHKWKIGNSEVSTLIEVKKYTVRIKISTIHAKIKIRAITDSFSALSGKHALHLTNTHISTANLHWKIVYFMH